jgi:peroxiredoxin
MKTVITVTALIGWSIFANAVEDKISGIYDPGILQPVDSRLLVAVGDKAPDFELPSVDGSRVRLSDYQGKHHVILSFVPAAWTPVCSSQWPGYDLVKDDVEQFDAVFVGITVDNIPTLHAWVKAMEGISFPVLSDFFPHGVVAQRYGILRSDGTSERALFIIDKEGVIRFIDVHDINERPPLEDIFHALQEIHESE